MYFQASRMFTSSVDGILIKDVTNIPFGMKVTSGGVGFSRYNGRVKIRWSFDGVEAILSKIYIKDATCPNNARLGAENVLLPNPDPSSVLTRSQEGLTYGKQVVFRCDPNDIIVVEGIMINNDATSCSKMTM